MLAPTGIAEASGIGETQSRNRHVLHSSTKGAVTSGSVLWGPSSALTAVERAARRAGWCVGVASLSDSDDLSKIGDVLQYFEPQRLRPRI